MAKLKKNTQQNGGLSSIEGGETGVKRKKLGRQTAEQSRETRRALLASAAAVFAERGLNGAKLDEIARRAGVTKGAIYRHFDDREDLLLQASRAAVRSLQLFEYADEAPDLLAFFSETAKVLLEPQSKKARMLNIEIHLSATRSEHMAELLAEWHAEVLETLKDRISPEGSSPEFTMAIIHILLLGLSHVDAFEAIGLDRDELVNAAGRVVSALTGEIKL